MRRSRAPDWPWCRSAVGRSELDRSGRTAVAVFKFRNPKKPDWGAVYGRELRADSSDGHRLRGYAAVFNEDTRIAGSTERIAPGAFKATLATGNDVLALVDHHPEALLGRTRSGKLKLAEDQRGLAFTVTLPDTSLARDVLDWPGISRWRSCSLALWLGRCGPRLAAVASRSTTPGGALCSRA